MRKMVNRVNLEGYVYNHNLEVKVSGPNSKNPGTEFISGTLSIATDDDCLNIVDVHFTYTVATTSKGNPNSTYKTLKDIIDGNLKTVMNSSKESAAKVRIDTAIALNEWYDDKNELISVKRNEGGFIHTVAALNEDANARNKFETDIILTGSRTIEADPDRDLPEKLVLKGAIFNFRNDLLPVEFSVVNPNAISYFESLGITNKTPVFTKIRGRQISETITRTITEEGAFGDSVREVTNTRKDSVITWAASEPYVWDDEETITVAEFEELIAKRETDLAALKSRTDAYRAERAASQGAAATSAPANSGGFSF